MFPSYPTLVSRHRALFDVQNISGLMISQSIPVSPAIFTYVVNLPFLKVEFEENQNGQKYPIPPVTRIFQSTLIFPFSKCQFIFGIGKSISAQFNYSPYPWISLSSSLRSNAPAEISISTSNSFSNFIISASPDNYNFLVSGGTEFLHFGGQIGYSHHEPICTSIMVGHQDDEMKFQWILVKDDQIATIAKVQNSFVYKIYPIDIGLALQLTQKQIDATLSWKTEIKGHTIHSSIKTPGIVQTSFKTKLNSVCDMAVSGKLNHKDCDYSFGVSLNFL
ncbi:hypothetical protein TRFO_07458 [Tritrichomonas foetus]|uniref:Eukaryotic porin family protein n=1 Tax=Tritrichomonas foetus TaxID=1144522 RepID=A0A1J4JRC1_9EUKA|nr:hypothetical protein TRFO_07458 [Tritrichomonas foetus]|eukprot:OHT01579.1 hypothetical protein TRFO_07458 [Tritrichomonas foetus]